MDPRVKPEDEEGMQKSTANTRRRNNNFCYVHSNFFSNFFINFISFKRRLRTINLLPHSVRPELGRRVKTNFPLLAQHY